MKRSTIDRRAGLLAIAGMQLACLESPPGSDEVICASFSEWADPVALPEFSEIEAASPTVSGDTSLLVWETPGDDLAAAIKSGDIYQPAPIGLLLEVNSTDSERNPTLSADGLTLWLTRGSRWNAILVVSRRDGLSDDFPAAEPVEGMEEVLVEAPDTWDDGHTLVLSVVEEGRVDLATATCASWRMCSLEGWIEELALDLDDLYPTVRSDGLELIYNIQSSNSLLAAARPTLDDPFEPLEVLDFPAYDPDFSGDGRTLFMQKANRIQVATRECNE